MNKTITIAFLFVFLLINYKSVAQCNANAGEDKEVCKPTTQLSANNPSPDKGTWSVMEGNAVFSSATNYATTVSELNEGINRLVWTIDTDNCQSSDEIVITYTKVDVYAGDRKFACHNNETVLEAADPSPGKGVWTMKSGGGIFENKSTHNTKVTQLSEDNVFVWNVSYLNCNFTSEVVILNRTVSEAIVYTDNTEICTPQISLEANRPNTNGGHGKWIVVKGDTNFDDELSPTVNLTNISYGENIFQWQIFRDPVCYSRAEITVTNNTVDAILQDEYITCNGTKTIEAELMNNASGEWQITEGNATLNILTINIVELTNLKSGTNQLKWTIEKGICFDTKTTTVINDMVMANAGDDISTCRQSVNLNANELNYGSGLWELTSGTANLTNKTSPNAGISNMENGEYKLLWTVESDNCSANDEVIVNCNYFDVGIVEQITPECLKCNGSIEVEAPLAKAPVQYQWNEQARNQISTLASNLCTGVFVVEVTDANNCTGVASLAFTNENSRIPVPEIFGETTVFTGSDNVKYYTNGKGEQYNWTVSNGNIDENKNDTIFVEWTTAGAGFIDLQLTTVCGAVNAPAFEVEIKEAETLPPNQNLLFPDGDGQDDVFVIRELDECMECYPNSLLQVFTSTGVMVYNQQKYDNTWSGVANQNKSGELPQGTYYYVFYYDMNNKSEVKKGYVVLFR